MLKIDTHAHWFPPQWLELLAAEGNGNGAEVSKNAEGDVSFSAPGYGTRPKFGKQYVDTPRTRPLGDNPLLVTKLQRRAGQDGRLVIGLLPTQGEGIFLTLDEPLLHGFIKLLQKAVERAEWGFKLDLPWGEAGAPGGERTLQ